MCKETDFQTKVKGLSHKFLKLNYGPFSNISIKKLRDYKIELDWLVKFYIFLPSDKTVTKVATDMCH